MVGQIEKNNPVIQEIARVIEERALWQAESLSVEIFPPVQGCKDIDYDVGLDKRNLIEQIEKRGDGHIKVAIIIEILRDLFTQKILPEMRREQTSKLTTNILNGEKINGKS